MLSIFFNAGAWAIMSLFRFMPLLNNKMHFKTTKLMKWHCSWASVLMLVYQIDDPAIKNGKMHA